MLIMLVHLVVRPSALGMDMDDIIGVAFVLRKTSRPLLSSVSYEVLHGLPILLDT